MPEPIVIIGPAAGPNGPAHGSAPTAQAESVEQDVAPAKTLTSYVRGSSAFAFGHFTSGLSRIAARAFGILFRLILNLARTYPRHSLAAVASLLILGAVLYSQFRSSAGGRHPVTAEIPSDSSTAVADNVANAVNKKGQEVRKHDVITTSDTKKIASSSSEGNPNDPADITRSNAVGPSDLSTSTPAPAVTTRPDAHPPGTGDTATPAPSHENQSALAGKLTVTPESTAVPIAEVPATPSSTADQTATTLLARVRTGASPLCVGPDGERR